MAQILKYKDLIAKQNIKCECPPSECQEMLDTPAYRWGLSPITHDANLLPNLVYDNIKGSPPRRNSKDDKVCENCALSFFVDKNKAIKSFNNLSPSAKQNIGYTHVIHGTVAQTDGLRNVPTQAGHFILFEYAGIELKNKFSVIETLNV